MKSTLIQDEWNVSSQCVLGMSYVLYNCKNGSLVYSKELLVYSYGLLKYFIPVYILAKISTYIVSYIDMAKSLFSILKHLLCIGNFWVEKNSCTLSELSSDLKVFWSIWQITSHWISFKSLNCPYCGESDEKCVINVTRSQAGMLSLLRFHVYWLDSIELKWKFLEIVL